MSVRNALRSPEHRAQLSSWCAAQSSATALQTWSMQYLQQLPSNLQGCPAAFFHIYRYLIPDAEVQWG